MKRCIFHYPSPIESKPGVGSALRPYRMVDAFRQMGYQVDEVTGYSKERKEKIKQIKQNIKNGVRYEFVYAENVNSPVAYADADNVPRHPLMDCAFFKFCRKQGIPVGLFYRDVYWKFPIFKEATTPLKRMFLLPAFRWDLRRYNKCLDLMFLPTMRMGQYVLPDMPAKPLPPGGHVYEDVLQQKKDRIPVKDGILRVFYVGSLSSLYDNTKLFQAVQATPNVELTVCTPQKQWEKMKDHYAPYLCERIQIVHESGEQLIRRYVEADVSAYCLQKSEYLDFAMPIKVFEAISYGTPLLVADIHSISQFVQEQDIGWNTENTTESVAEMLQYLVSHPEEVAQKTANVIDAVPRNTWPARAKTAAETLEGIRK